MIKTLTISAIIISVILLSGTLGFALSNPDAFAAKGGTPKVAICHIAPDNPDNRKTLTIPVKAVPDHIAHGDFVGTCEAGPDCEGFPDQPACEEPGFDGTQFLCICFNGETAINNECFSPEIACDSSFFTELCLDACTDLGSSPSESLCTPGACTL